MNDNGQIDASLILAEKLKVVGVKLTPQRALVYDVIVSLANHPSAEEVFARARDRTPSISLATVYNCLEVLVSCGAIRAVRGNYHGARFCANSKLHAHLHLDGGGVMDVPLTEENARYILELLPTGYSAGDFDLNFTGGRRIEASK
jgi:Fur family transcriptional regulator, peroxide stress response regulator